jgi:hypothetical protein
MDAFVVGTAVAGSILGALAIEKAALEGLLRLMNEGWRSEPEGHSTSRPE